MDGFCVPVGFGGVVLGFAGVCGYVWFGFVWVLWVYGCVALFVCCWVFVCSLRLVVDAIVIYDYGVFGLWCIVIVSLGCAWWFGDMLTCGLLLESWLCFIDC